MFGRGPDGISRVSMNGGVAEQLVNLRAGEAADSPQVLPGGDAVLFTLAASGGTDRWNRAQIVVQSLKSGERKIIVNGGSDGRYLPSGIWCTRCQAYLFAVGSTR